MLGDEDEDEVEVEVGWFVKERGGVVLWTLCCLNWALALNQPSTFNLQPSIIAIQNPCFSTFNPIPSPWRTFNPYRRKMLL